MDTNGLLLAVVTLLSPLQELFFCLSWQKTSFRVLVKVHCDIAWWWGVQGTRNCVARKVGQVRNEEFCFSYE